MSKDDRSVISWLGFAAAIAALVVALFGMRDDGDGGSSSSGSSGGGGSTETAELPVVDLYMGDLFFRPETLTVPPTGAIIHLVNEGSATHNMELRELGLKSPDVPSGQMYDWTIGPFDEGDYTLVCPQPGHEQAGMVGTMTVSSSAEVSPGTDLGTDTGTGTQEHVNWSQMDANMLGRAQLYPAVTQGDSGANVYLEPEIVTENGEQIKVFNIEAKVVDWEVEPGKIVQAWTYNGMVPAPTIKAFSGDHIRVVLTNSLPESTSLHFHGIEVPNVMDGVDPYTEAPTIPGAVHIYDWIARGPAVGMYHSHHDAQEQIPNGMFGAFMIDDIPMPQKLIDKGYPAEATKTVNMVLNDAGVIGLSLNGKSFPATTPYTIRVGEVMIVNYFNEGLMPHPMHMHQPLGWVIAKDGEPLDEPLPTDTVNIAPGERYTVAYLGLQPGVWAWHCHILTHAETADGMRYMVTALIVERGDLPEAFLEANPEYRIPLEVDA